MAEINNEKAMLEQEKKQRQAELDRIQKNPPPETNKARSIDDFFALMMAFLPIEVIILVIIILFRGIRFVSIMFIVVTVIIIMLIELKDKWYGIGNKKTNDAFLNVKNKIGEIDRRLEALNCEYNDLKIKEKREIQSIEKIQIEEKYQTLYKNKFKDVNRDNPIDKIIVDCNFNIDEHILKDYLLCSNDELFMDNNKRFDYLTCVNQIVDFSIGEFDDFLDKADQIIQTPIRRHREKKLFSDEIIFDKYIKKLYDEVVNHFNEIVEWYDDLQEEYAIIKAGVDGEAYVENAVKDLNLNSICLYNFSFEYNGEYNEIDLLVLSVYGVFTIEVKNYHRKKIRFTRDGNWIETQYDPEEEMYMDNIVEKHPVKQNTRHEMYLEKIINSNMDKGSTPIKVKGIIAIANNETEIVNEGNYTIVRANSIASEIRNNEVVFSQKDLRAIEKIISKYKVPTEKFKIRNYMSNSKLVSFKDVIYYREAVENFEYNKSQYKEFADEVVRDSQAIYESRYE